MSDIYLSLTETPTVVTLSQPVVSGVLSSNVTVTNVVSVNVVTMPAITVQAAAPSVTTVAGTVTISGFTPSTLPPSTVTVGNTVTIAGTVTANLSTADSAEIENIRIETQFINAKLTNPFPVSGAVTASLVALGAGGLFPVEGNDGWGALCAQVGNENGTINASNPLNISGTVTVGSSVTIGSLPAISGTVTANVFGLDSQSFTNRQIPILPYNEAVEGMEPYVVPVQISNTLGAIQAGNSLPISGTVTANLAQGLIDESGDVGSQAPRLVAGVYDVQGQQFGEARPFPISGTVTVGNSVTIGSMPNGALTTRFGSVTTANTAQITSAVTNTSRKYLLAQNISAGTVTIGIGFSPTTTQGIQLTAGGGLTFDAFCPTGAVYWLGAVTGANYCLIEG